MTILWFDNLDKENKITDEKHFHLVSPVEGECCMINENSSRLSIIASMFRSWTGNQRG